MVNAAIDVLSMCSHRSADKDRTGAVHARVVQHECDHLIGILYPMRMRDLSRFGYTDIIFPDSAPDAD